MSDLSAMSTFEKYVQGLSLLTPEQLGRCKAAQEGLQKLGLPKGLEEVAVRLGILDSTRLGEILADIKKKWSISILRPVIFEVSAENDRALQEMLVQKGPDSAAHVLEAREVQEKAAALGLTLSVTEILIAKGHYTPPPAEPTLEELLQSLPPLPEKDAAPRKIMPAPRKPVAAAAVPKRPPTVRREVGGDEEAPKKNRKLLWIGVGAGAALVLIVVIVLIATSKPDAPPPEAAKAPPKVVGKQTLLFAEGFDTIPVYSEANLLAWHAGQPPKADASVPVNTPVTLRSFLRTEKSLWYFVRTQKGVEGWVNAAQVKANYDIASVSLQDFGTEWSEKLADAKGIPRPVAKVEEKPAPVPAAPTPAPKPPVREPEPAAKPEKEPEPAPVPEKTPEPEKPAPTPAPATPAPATPPPPKAPATPAPKPADAAREGREKKAQGLWELAEKLEKDNKPADAQERLRELRTRYRSTRVYWDKMIEITDKINELGQKVAAAALVKTGSYKRPHMDAWWSFEFVPPEGWKGVPSQPNLVGEQDNDESFYKGRTYQIARYNAPYLDKLYIVILKTFACTGLDNLEQKVTGELEERFKGLKEETKTALTGRMPYLRKTYVSNDGDRIAIYYYFSDRKGIALAGVWRAGGDGMYVSITTFGPEGKTTRKSSDLPVPQADFNSAMKVFDQSARTFWIYDAASRAGKRTELGIGGSLCSDWSTLKSSKGNYIIEYATRQDFAKKAGEEMEQIQALYKHVIPTQKPIPPCRIKIFDREEDFKDYSNAIGAAAYWSPMQEEIVAYRFEGDRLKLDSKEEFTVAEERNPEEVTFKVLYHEGFHQYMHFYMGRARNIYVPSWLNEGMGDYFFGGEWNKTHSKFTLGVNDWRIRKIASAVKKNEHVPLDKIFRYEQSQYYRTAGLCYAEGWAINYFFQMSDVAKKKGYNTIPMRMMEELKASGNWEKATDKAFAGVDFKKMEEEWKEFVLSLPVPKDNKDEDDPFK